MLEVTSAATMSHPEVAFHSALPHPWAWMLFVLPLPQRDVSVLVRTKHLTATSAQSFDQL